MRQAKYAAASRGMPGRKPRRHDSAQTHFPGRFLIQEQQAGRINVDLHLLIEVVARACKSIATVIGEGAPGGAASAGLAPLMDLAPSSLNPGTTPGLAARPAGAYC